MKRIKAYLLGAWLVVTACALWSCNDDDDYYYDTGYLLPRALVTVKPNSDNTSFYMQLDDSTTLQPMNMRTSPFGTKEVRALVNYDYEGAVMAHQLQAVRVNWIDSILTKPTAVNYGEKNDSAYGNDPVEIVNSWETVAEDGYLTLRFRTRWAPGSIHQVNLVHRADSTKPYIVQLYHDANGSVGAGDVADGLVAFRLDDAFNRPDSTIEITLQWNSYSGTKTHNFKYRPRKDSITTD